MRPEYDLDYTKAERGKYYRRLIKEGSNVVVLEPDIAKEFRNSDAVNDALRKLLEISGLTQQLTASPSKRSRKPDSAGR